jgi:hypothetical protein
MGYRRELAAWVRVGVQPQGWKNKHTLVDLFPRDFLQNLLL